MDFLNKAMAQLSDLFKSMTPGARLTAGLLLAVVVVSLGYLFNHQMVGGDTFLLGGQSFTPGELSAMEAAFGKAGLSNYEVQGGRVSIPGVQKAVYMAALVDNGALPAHFGEHLATALEKVGPFTSRDQREELMKVAKQQELNGIILSMQNIEKVSVQYDTPKKNGFRPTGSATASVSVKSHGTLPLDEKQVPMIRHLVAGAFAGLSPENVSVIDLNGRSYSGSSSDGMSSASEDPYVARMKEYQSLYESQIHNALSYVPGITVTAHVELNKELRSHQEKDVVDPKLSAPLMSREESTTTTSKSGSNSGGRPGFEAHQANASAKLTAGGGNESSEEHSTNETQNVPSRDRTTTETAGLTPKRVTAAIGVPTSYFESIWRQRNPAAAGQAAKMPDRAAIDLIAKEEIEKIRAFVANIVPQAADAAAGAPPLVTVTAFSHVVADDLTGPSIATQAMNWLSGSWQTLGTIVLVLFSLNLLRSLARAPVAEIVDASPNASLQAAAPAAGSNPPTSGGTPTVEVLESGEAGGRSRPKLKRKLGTGPNLRDDLAEMVRDDPDAAAAILRNWIGTGK